MLSGIWLKSTIVKNCKVPLATLDWLLDVLSTGNMANQFHSDFQSTYTHSKYLTSEDKVTAGFLSARFIYGFQWLPSILSMVWDHHSIQAYVLGPMTKYNPDLADIQNSRGQTHVLLILKHFVGKYVNTVWIQNYWLLRSSPPCLNLTEIYTKKQLDGKVVKVIIHFRCLKIFYVSFIFSLSCQLQSNWAECTV